MSLNSTCVQLHFRDHAEQNRTILLFQNRSRTTRRWYYIGEKSKHQNLNMTRFEKYLYKTRQQACNNRRTYPSTHWSQPTVMAAPTTEWEGSLISMLLIIRSPHRCGRCRSEPRTGHMWDKPSSACECVRWFCWGTIILLHLPIGLSRCELNNLERDVNLNKKYL